MGSSLLRKRLILGGALVVILVMGVAVAFVASTWGEVERVSIDRPTAPAPEAATPVDDVELDDETDEPVVEVEPEVMGPGEGLEVFLLVGSDSRDDLDDLRGFGRISGNRADVVMVLLRTETEAAVLSLPRDLWVTNTCTGREARINGMLQGCGEKMNGPTLLTLAVESLIGETVDHFAMVDLAGFQNAVDAIGGYEICVELPVRDMRSNLELPAGCTMASGDQALAWLRSRHTQELTDAGWRTMSGMSDLARNDRQRAFLISMMASLSDFSSPQAVTAAAQAVAPFLTVDTGLTLIQAVNLAWTMRGLSSGSVIELSVPVYGYTTEQGASVLLPSTPVDEIVAGFVVPETADSANLATG
jgi:LCP family protein required for cell wall assembly